MVSPTTAATSPEVQKAKRERSPSFPFIPLKTAIARLVAFDDYSKRHPVPAKHSGLAWGMKGFTSQSQQTLAALKAFGLIEYQGTGKDLSAIVTEDGRTYLRAQQDSIKLGIIKRIALKPKALAKFFSKWGLERPADPICLDELVLKNRFTDAAAKLFLSVYDDTIAFSGLSSSDKIDEQGQDPDLDGMEDEDDDETPKIQFKIGDNVQWTSGGVDQFKSPRRVESVFPGGTHVQVFGENTGVPMSELSLAEPPAVKPLPSMTALQYSPSSQNDLNVLLKGNRLQITADVDLEGIAELKEILGHYEAILVRIAARTKKS